MIRIVVVEDVSMTRVGLVSMIRSAGRGRFVVVGEAENGQAAVDLIVRQRPDVVFSDVKMPVMDGIQLMERTKEMGIEVPFILMSAYNDYDYVRRAMLMGAQDYLLKLDIDYSMLEQLLSSLWRQIIGEENGIPEMVVAPRDTGGNVAADGDDLDPAVARVEEALRRLAPEAIHIAFGALRQKLSDSGAKVSLQQLYGICYTLIYMVNQVYTDNAVESDWNRGEALSLLMRNCHSAGQYLDYVRGLEEQCVQILHAQREKNGVIQQSKRFMQRNFKEDLSLEDIAGHVRLNPSYFSRLFTKEVGQSCIDYLTTVRIERAKELLDTSDAKIVQISAQCGYNSPYYFSRIFKKSTGLAPQEWRKRTRSEQNCDI